MYRPNAKAELSFNAKYTVISTRISRPYITLDSEGRQACSSPDTGVSIGSNGVGAGGLNARV